MASRKKNLEDQAKDLNDELFRDLGIDEEGELCLLLQSTARLGSSDLEVNDVYKLADGSRVVHTVEGAYALLEGHLLDEEEELVTSHGDSRGVLAFPDAHLEEVRGCRDYQGAVTCVGKRGRWLASPKTRRKVTKV